MEGGFEVDADEEGTSEERERVANVGEVGSVCCGESEREVLASGAGTAGDE